MQDIDQVRGSFSGRIGLAAINLETCEELTLDADTLFPIASVLKVPVLLEVLLQAGEGRFSLDDQIEPMSQRAFGSGVLKELSDQVRMTVRDVGILMIVISDNTSTNALIDLVGGVDVINARMRTLGYTSITLHSNIPLPRRLAPGEPLPNVKTVAEATPAEVARLMAELAGRRLAAPAICDQLLAIMARQQFVDQVPRYYEYDAIAAELGIVQRVAVANKTGFHPGTRCDAGVITMEGGTSFAYAVFNTGSNDTSMSDESEGAIANGRIGRLLLEHWWPAALGPSPVRNLPTWHR
jgi:beta-lactamase class A